MFKLVPPWLLTLLILLITLFRFVFSLFLGSVYGLLILVLIIYFNSEFLFGTTPITFNELFILILSLSDSMKAAIISSVITISGFIVAYATATASWKSQLITNLKVQASSDIVDFYNEFSRKSNDCQIIAESILNTRKSIIDGASYSESISAISYCHSQTQTFFTIRDSLSSASISCHTFLAKYNSILQSSYDANKNIQRANSAVGLIANSLWIPLPYPIANDDDPVKTFLEQTNSSKYNELIKTVNEQSFDIIFCSGAVSGSLQQSIIQSNYNYTKNLFIQSKSLLSALKENYKKLNKS